MPTQEQQRDGEELEVLRQVAGGDLASRVRQYNPRWDALFTAAESHQVLPKVVYGAVLDGGTGRVYDALYPFQRVAIVVDREERRRKAGDDTAQQFVLDEYDALTKELTTGTKRGLPPEEIQFGQEALRLIKEVVYPDYFPQEPRE